MKISNDKQTVLTVDDDEADSIGSKSKSICKGLMNTLPLPMMDLSSFGDSVCNIV